MPPSQSELKLARSWIGDKETDEVFTERYNRLGSLDEAILESMTAQLSAMIFNRDAMVTLDDGTSVNSSSNIKALQDLIEEFSEVGGVDGGSGAMNTTKLARRRYR